MVLDNHSIVKVSVIVPVHNVENYLRQCLDSLKNQTLKEIEFIIINDCSTDNCGAICEEYAKNDNRFIILQNETNIRQGLSRNRGIDIAKGEYIGFIDADDYIDSDYYEKLYSTAKINHSDIAKTEPVLLNIDGSYELQSELNIKIQEGLRNRKPIFLLFNYEHWSAIYRRNLMINFSIRYPNIRNAEDDVFLLRFNYYASNIVLISNTHYYYRQHPASTVSVREKPFFESILHCFDLKLEFLNTHEMKKEHYIISLQYELYKVNELYKEIEMKPHSDDFKFDYAKEALMIIKKNKYKADVLNCLYWGFKEEETAYQYFKQGFAYKMHSIISKIKVRLSILLSL